MATFLEKLLSGFYNPNKTEPLNVGKEGGYPRYVENDELTAESFNVVTDKVDELTENTNDGLEKLLRAIKELAQKQEDSSQQQLNVDLFDNQTLKINPITGKLEVVDIPPQTPASRIIYINPDTGELTGITINKKIENIDNKLSELESEIHSISFDDEIYVRFENKGSENDITIN